MIDGHSPEMNGKPSIEIETIESKQQHNRNLKQIHYVKKDSFLPDSAGFLK